MATQFLDTTADHKWSTAGNWSDGIPDAADAVTIGAAVTALNIDTAAACLSFDATGPTTITISGTGALTVSGSFTLDAGVTWTNTGILSLSTNPSTVTTAGVSLGTAASVHIKAGCDATLAGNINTGTKALYVYGAGSSLDSGNYQIDCGIFGDNGQSGAITLTLGTSTINCTPKISFSTATLTLTANTATVNITGTGTDLNYFGGKVWGGTVTIISGPSALYAFINDSSSNTFGNLTLVSNPGASSLAFIFSSNTTISGNLTITSNLSVTGGNIIPLISGSNNTPVQRTLTVNGSVVINGTNGGVHFRDIKGAGSASWDLSEYISGDLGGNSDITFRTAQTYYLSCEANVYRQDYNNVWSTTDDGVPDGSLVYPLAQDTIVINDNSFTGTGQSFYFHSGGGKTGNVITTDLTKSVIIGLPQQVYGSIDWTGSGVVIPTNQAYGLNGWIDARLVYERSGNPLTLNIPQTLHSTQGATIRSFGGTVRLGSNLTLGGTCTLTIGTLDLNGHYLTAGVFSSTNSNARTIQDTTGGGKIILNGATGTLFDTTTATNLTVSNAPDIQIGDGTKTLTGNVTFMGAGKTYGDFTVKKHAGDYDCIITGSNTFGALTLETPDDTYPYSDLQLTVSTTQVAISLSCNGSNSHQIDLKGTADHASLSIASGTPTVTYTDIENLQGIGGASFKYGSGSTITGDTTGWSELIAAGSPILSSSIMGRSPVFGGSVVR